MDRAVGGPGMRLGRRDPDRVRVGDAVDSFRVEVADRPRLLRLRAEMRMPGQGWLEWTITATGSGAELVQRARYHPHGLLGRLGGGEVAVEDTGLTDELTASFDREIALEHDRGALRHRGRARELVEADARSHENVAVTVNSRPIGGSTVVPTVSVRSTSAVIQPP